MAIECFGEIISTIYIVKRLHDIGKYGLAAANFFDMLDCDTYYENMYSLIENLFEHHYCRYSENRYVELHILQTR